MLSGNETQISPNLLNILQIYNLQSLSMETETKFKNDNQNISIQSNYKSLNVSNSGQNDILWTSSSFPMQCYSKYQERYRNVRGYKVNSLLKNNALNNYLVDNNLTEQPMDLTCATKRSCQDFNKINKNCPKTYNLGIENCWNSKNYNTNNIGCSDVGNYGRKRKYEHQDIPFLNTNHNSMKSDNSEYLQITDNKRAEVLKAAKSLFSKRTRTLYHWIYPNAPKPQLKAAVAASWETLGNQEKEFYISQVLGRFGFPQANLMINPQLGGLSRVLPLPPLDLTCNSIANEETSSAVSSLLLSENRNSAQETLMNLSTSLLNNSPFNTKCSKKKNRLGRPPGSKNRKWIKEEYPVLKQIRDDLTTDEFQDDPELNREFQQFRWSLHLNDNIKS